ncbi:hypothetical protein OH492_07065 [Vibrio chagasii]|nr:hypothetical protein [Vibrio chagasii]
MLLSLSLKLTLALSVTVRTRRRAKFTQSALITDDVLKGIQDAATFVPHNPVTILIGIEAFQQNFPGLKNVAVFDTAFHQTSLLESYLYALPYNLYKRARHPSLRHARYFSPIHHCEVAGLLNKPVEEVNIINCHPG